MQDWVDILIGDSIPECGKSWVINFMRWEMIPLMNVVGEE